MMPGCGQEGGKALRVKGEQRLQARINRVGNKIAWKGAINIYRSRMMQRNKKGNRKRVVYELRTRKCKNASGCKEFVLKELAR